MLKTAVFKTAVRNTATAVRKFQFEPFKLKFRSSKKRLRRQTIWQVGKVTFQKL